MTTTRYQIALYKPNGPMHHLCFAQRTTKTALARLIQEHGRLILDVTQMPEDFEFTFRPNRILLNDGWVFGRTGLTERMVGHQGTGLN